MDSRQTLVELPLGTKYKGSLMPDLKQESQNNFASRRLAWKSSWQIGQR